MDEMVGKSREEEVGLTGRIWDGAGGTGDASVSMVERSAARLPGVVVGSP